MEVETLKLIEIIHPGLKEMLKKTAQAQEKYNLRTALDQRGQKMIKMAKLLVV